MSEIIFLIEESLEGGFTAKALGIDIFTQADTINQLKEMIKDAVICHYDKDQMPGIVRMHYVRDETFSIAI